MISNAANTPLNANTGTLPNVGDAILDYFQPMMFTTLAKTVVNAITVETPTDVAFSGVWQPFTDRQLEMKPEGQRAWSWYMLHADPSLQLKPDDVVKYLGKQYRVMQSRDYTLYGYMQYQIIADYTGSGPT